MTHPTAENLLSAPAESLLAPDQLIELAIAATGLSEFGDLDFLPSLARMCDALGSAQLNGIGRRQVNRVLAGRLANRLLMHEQQRRMPSVAAIAVHRPVFLIGLHRTGSTYAHGLLGQHPALCWPAAWGFYYVVVPVFCHATILTYST